MKHRTLAVAAMLVLISLTSVATPTVSATETSQTFQLGKGDWVALRYNLSGDSDLRLTGRWSGCRNSTAGQETVIGVVMLAIPDGERVEVVLGAPGNSAWGLGSDMAHANIAGSKVILPVTPPEVSCDGADILTGPRAYAASQSFTFVLVNLAPAGSVTVHASYTAGVSSSDSSWGAGVVRTKNDFAGGAHVNVYPVPTGVSTGAGLSADFVMAHDVVGWFWPEHRDTLGRTVWTCAEKGTSCATPRPSGMIPLGSSGPTTYSFTIDAETKLAENPYFALGLVELPDGTFL